MAVLRLKRRVEGGIKRRFFIDRYNDKKIWEVAYLEGTHLVRQYLKKDGNNYDLLGKGSRRSKRELTELGILEFEEITNIKFIQEE